jgi:hypothetical protein
MRLGTPKSQSTGVALLEHVTLGIDQILKGMEQKLDRIDQRMEKIEQRLDKLIDRVDWQFYWTLAGFGSLWVAIAVLFWRVNDIAIQVAKISGH